MAVRLPAAARRQQLLDVARDLFAASGFHATSMDDVAEAAGVTKPVLYQHFANKRALYVELLEDVGQRLMSAVAEATADAGSGRDQVRLGFDAYFSFVAANQSSFRLLFGASVRNDAEFAAVAQQVADAIAVAISGLIAVDVAAEQRHVLAHALVGMAEATGRKAIADGTIEEPGRLADWLAEMAWYGLRGIRPAD